MFARLVGSAPVHEHSVGSTSVSIVMHAAMVVSGVVFTAHMVTAHEKVTAETIYYPKPAPAPAPGATPHAGAKCDLCVAPKIPSLPFPPDIPLTITAPNTSVLPPDLGGELIGGRASSSGAPCVDCGSFPTAPEVLARALPGNPQPIYPSILRESRIEGVIAAHFVVDSTGRVDSNSITFKSGGEALFEHAVRRALLASRYEPARTGGRPVAMRVEQSFTFRITP